MDGTVPLDAALALLGPDDTAVIATDLEILEGQLEHLVRHFPSSTSHAIAIKTMPHPRMLSELAGHGVGLEAASIEEVELAIDAGVDPGDIVFDSPAKTILEIQRCHELFPGMLLNANSLAELDRMPTHPSFRLGLRINPEVSSDAPSMFAVSTPGSKFGVALSRHDEILAAALEHPITVLHVHVGSQVADVRIQIEALSRIVALADSIDAARARTGSPLRIESIDIGGGWRADDAPAASLASTRVTDLVAGLSADLPAVFDRHLITEPGQWIHTHAGWTGSIVEYAELHPRPHVVIHVGADLFLRDAYGTPRNFPFELHRRRRDTVEAGTIAYDVDGPLCFSGDTIARGVMLPPVEAGNWIAIRSTGANTLGLWSRHCSRHVPAVVALRGDIATLWSPRRRVA
jgi:diaminopimelate decarboxylase